MNVNEKVAVNGTFPSCIELMGFNLEKYDMYLEKSDKLWFISQNIASEDHLGFDDDQTS